MSIAELKAWAIASWQIMSRHQRLAFTLLSAALLLSVLVGLKLLSSNAALKQHVDQVESVNQGLIDAASNPQASQQAALQVMQQRLVEHTSSVMTLQRWLLSGRNTQDEANVALTMLQHLQKLRTEPDDIAWQSYSGALSRLENAVKDNSINTPEATALIASLRSDYAVLRDQVGSLSVQASTATQANGASSAQLQTSLQLLNQHRRSMTKWFFALLPLLLISAAAAAWWFYLSTKRSVEEPQSAIRTVDSRANQNAILQLLDEMEPLANGDLRVQATVSEAMTGALADGFNYAVSELRWLVGAINGSAAQVTESVSKTRDSANNLAQASAVQAREIHRSSNYLNVMSDTMAQLSAHAAESSRIAVDSVKQAQVGTLAVDASVKGLVNIREQAHMTSRMMQRLVESSDAIKKHVLDIQRVAKNTDLLALNTTIRAAASTGGEQTSELSQLSAEVTQLASTLRLATRDISHLAGIIEQDAALTLSSVKKTNNELDAGHQKAIQASQSLKAIEAVSHDLQNQINDIASKTLRQAGVVRQLSSNMGVINGITRDSTVGLQDAARDLEDLQLMATGLLQSVAGFTLPGERGAYELSSGSSKVAKKIKAAVAVDHRSKELATKGDVEPARGEQQ